MLSQRCQAQGRTSEGSLTLQRAMDLGTEKGASTWLTALALQD